MQMDLNEIRQEARQRIARLEQEYNRKNGTTINTLEMMGEGDFGKRIDEAFRSAKEGDIYVIFGAPGSGASTLENYLKEQKKIPTKSVVNMSPDDVMLATTGFQKDRETLGNKAAFAKWEIPTRVTSIAINEIAEELGLSTVYNRSGGLKDSTKFIEKAKKDSRRVHLFINFTDTENLEHHLAAREKETGLVLNIEVAKERAASLANNRHDIFNSLSYGDTVEVYYNPERKSLMDFPPPVAVKKDGQESPAIINDSAYAKFVKQADLTKEKGLVRQQK